MGGLERLGNGSDSVLGFWIESFFCFLVFFFHFSFLLFTCYGFEI